MTMEKTFNPGPAEAEIAAKWEKAKAFRAGANARPGAPSYCIMIPPPNVTGSLHVGHAFNNTLQDILVRWHRMRGDDVLWQPGQDHAGIATQMVVERELAKGNQRRTDFTREEFVAKVWEWKEQSGDTIINQLKRLGASCDWDRNAFTMDDNFQKAVLKVFVDFYNKGLIFRGKRLVNWDPHFETAISDLEVENIEVDGHMWHFKYPLAGGATYEYVEKDEDGKVTLRETRDYISIATTRPETMLGDGAVAVHPDDARYAPIVGQMCEIPVGPKEHRRLIPIITDEYPEMNFGSGAVKITGAHDFNDYQVAKRGGIPLYSLMDTKGAMRADGAPYGEAATRAKEIAEGAEFTEAEVVALNLVPEEYRGLNRFAARDLIVARITAEGLAVMTEKGDPDTNPPSFAMEGRRKRKLFGVWQGPENGEFYVEDSYEEAVAKASLRHAGKQIRFDSDIEDSEPMGDGFYDPVSRADIVWLRPAYPKVENKKIMAPYGDRSKVVIEPMLTDQWFVDTAKIVKPALAAVRDGRTKIIPEQHRKVYENWLEAIEPWCISRQLWWGHQIPVWYGPKIRESEDSNLVGMSFAHSGLQRFCAESEGEAIALAADYYGQGVNVLGSEGLAREEFDRLFTGIAMDQIREQGFGSVPIYRDPDVLDTWFSSGLWPIGTLGWPEPTPELKKYFPTNDLITGFDIIFFWVARMMMMQLEITGEVPFDTVYVHALVRDEQGRKMSKSLGNVMDPLELMDEFGTDALRFTLTSMAAMGRDVKLSKDRIAGYRNFGTKLWNVARFAEMNECAPVDGFDPKACTQTVNRWIIGETARAREALDAALTAYRFNDAANGLYAHVWGRVCDWYVELAKPLLQEGEAGPRDETRATMAWVLDQCLLMLHPIMPFMTEQLWGDIAKRSKLLVHGDWPTYTAADLADASADAEMAWVIGLIEAIRSVRAEMGVPAGSKITLCELGLDARAAQALADNRALIERLARIGTFEAARAAPKGAVTIPVEGGTFCLPLAGLIDVAAEKARLDKAAEKLTREMGGLQGKLANKKFTQNAPAEIVEENRARLVALGEEKAKIDAALVRLAEMQ